MAISELDPKLLLTEDTIAPEVKSDVFSAHPDAVFWAGIVAVGSNPVDGMSEEFLAARVLRANEYIYRGYLSEGARQADGGETDEDDVRSTHFAIIANEEPNRVRGTSRLILKQDADDVLPVEKFFPDVFDANPAPVGSVEASRFIARHPDKHTQHPIMLGLVRAMVAEAESEEAPYVYAVVEEYLAKLFSKINLVHDVVGQPVFIEEYNSVNKALRFNPREVLSQVRQDKFGQEIMQLFFASTEEDRGLGHYDGMLVNQVDGDK